MAALNAFDPSITDRYFRSAFTPHRTRSSIKPRTTTWFSLAPSASPNTCLRPPHGGVRLRTRRVCRWRDGKMVLRWAAAALLMTEQSFRRTMGYQDLWMLRAALDRNQAAL